MIAFLVDAIISKVNIIVIQRKSFIVLGSHSDVPVCIEPDYKRVKIFNKNPASNIKFSVF
jgi:hypothetical protein